MHKILFVIILTIAVMVLAILLFKSITADKIQNYKNTKPTFSMKKYFNGPIKGWGVIQDWRGNVVSKFDIELIGSWEGDTGTLSENFTYYTGATQQRVWTIKKLPDGKFYGTAPDIIGQADGQVMGEAGNWKYYMDIPVSGKTLRFAFDDWMWLMNDGVLINRSYLRKFGFTFAELTVFMKKQDQ